MWLPIIKCGVFEERVPSMFVRLPIIKCGAFEERVPSMFVRLPIIKCGVFAEHNYSFVVNVVAYHVVSLLVQFFCFSFLW